MISSELKVILRKYSERRTAEEVAATRKLVRRLKCLDHYPFIVKQEVGRVLYYDAFEDGKLVARQGRETFSFIFFLPLNHVYKVNL